MTTAEKADKVENIQAIRYVFDPGRTRQLGRPLEGLLLSRRCYQCASRYDGTGEPVPAAEEQIEEVAKCCSQQPDFIAPEMPLMEIVFRTILAQGNRPTTLHEIHDALTDRWATPTNPRHLSVETLHRVMGGDNYYGIREVAEGNG